MAKKKPPVQNECDIMWPAMLRSVCNCLKTWHSGMHRLWSNRVAAMAPIAGWSRAAKARPEKNRTSSKDHWSMFCGGQWSSTPLPSRKGYLKQNWKRTWQDWTTKAIKPQLLDVNMVPDISKYTRLATNVLFRRSAHCHRDLIKEVAVLYI